MTKKKPEQETLLKFPCLFPIKIMGLNKPELEKLVSSIMQDKITKKDYKTIEYSKHVSSHKKYLSITVKFMATSKTQLDDIYKELSKHCGKEDDKIIKMIL